MGAFQNDCEVGWDICMICKIGSNMGEVCALLLIELSFEGDRVYRRTLALFFIIDVHNEVLVQRELGYAEDCIGLWHRINLLRCSNRLHSKITGCDFQAKTPFQTPSSLNAKGWCLSLNDEFEGAGSYAIITPGHVSLC